MTSSAFRTRGAVASPVAAIHRALAAFDVVPARREDMLEARTFAARLIGEGIVTPETLKAVHERTGAGLFTAREDGVLTGVLAFVLLSPEGLEAVQADEFDALEPALEHMARRGIGAAGVYGWGVAAVTKDSARRLIQGSRAMGETATAHLAYYARPTTPAGEKLMLDNLGFQRCPGSTSGLVWAPPYAEKAAVAA